MQRWLTDELNVSVDKVQNFVRSYCYSYGWAIYVDRPATDETLTDNYDKLT